MKTLDEGELGGIGCPQLIGFCWRDAKIQGLVLHLELGKRRNPEPPAQMSQLRMKT